MTGGTRMRDRRGASPVVDALLRGLGPVYWLVIVVGAVLTQLLPGGPDGRPVRTAMTASLGVFFVLLLTRLVLAAVQQRGRRFALLALAVGVALWATGAAIVFSNQAVVGVEFPARGEIFYLASYLGIATFLFRDVSRRGVPSIEIVLEAAVVCGAAVCLAAVAVVTPLATTFQRGALPLLVSVLYPVIDVGLVVIVIAQVMLGLRLPSLRSFALALGFVGLAVGDTAFVLTLDRGIYTSSIALDVIWAAGLALIVGAACLPPVVTEAAKERRYSVVALPAAAALAVAILVLNPGGSISGYLTAASVLTLAAAGARMLLALREAQEAAESRRLSLTDEMTGLPNRRALLAAADERLRTGAPTGFLLLDIDAFKDVNDSMGHTVGDEVLRVLAYRMRLAVGDEVLVARLGGDEFALLARTDDATRLIPLARSVRDTLSEPMRVDDITLAITASIGIALARSTDSSTELLRRADIAMYEAKASPAGVVLFDASLDGASRARLRRGDDLRHAIAQGEIGVMYQPQVSAVDGRVVGVEALVRWQHPELGLLTPGAFLSDARRSGLMPEVSAIVLHHVLVDARRWCDDGFAFRVAMKCGPPELVGGPLLPRLFAEVGAAGLPEDTLVLEVLEDSFVAEPELAFRAIRELRAHHVQVAIDDYGIGYSSLAYLRDIPVQELKMDRSFIATVVTDERSRLIVRTTARMAHAFGFRMVAHGVGDAEIARAVVPLGVDVLQGYHVARPMPAEEVAPWIRSRAAGAEKSGVGLDA